MSGTGYPEKVTVEPENFNEIVFATNFKTYYKRREILPLLELAEKFKAPVRVVYIEGKRIHAFTESRGSSLLAIYNCKHNLFSGIFKKSIVQELGFNPQVPVLILQEHK